MAERLPAGLRGPPCYFPYFRNREEAMKALNRYVSKDGYFLIRNSTTTANTYTLSVTYQNGICHMKILFDENNNFYLQGDTAFHGMGYLISHYKTHSVPNEQRIQNLRLLHPVTRLGDGTLGETVPNTRRWTTGDVTPLNQAGLGMHRTGSEVKGRSARPKAQVQFEDLSKRPPEPLPTMTEAAPTYASHTYYIVPEEEISRLPQLRKALQVNEDQRKRCTCGLLVADSKLPEGWEVHRSDDAPTQGRVFFVSPEHQSHWDLPEFIYRLLNERQHKFVSELLASDVARCRRSNLRYRSDTG